MDPAVPTKDIYHYTTGKPLSTRPAFGKRPLFSDTACQKRGALFVYFAADQTIRRGLWGGLVGHAQVNAVDLFLFSLSSLFPLNPENRELNDFG